MKFPFVKSKITPLCISFALFFKGKKNQRNIVLFSFFLLMIFLTYKVPSLPKEMGPWTDGFAGNITASVIQGIMFLVLTMYLDGQTEEKIEKIIEISAKSERVLAEREFLLKNERLILEFEQFMSQESYHDVRFPDLKDDNDVFGLEYTIMPVRDPHTQMPHKYETESVKLFVVKVKEPAHISVLPPDVRNKYQKSPIKENHYYFCRFINDSWYMGADSPFTPHKFYLSGKVGPVEYGISANQFMEKIEYSYSSLTQLAVMYLKSDGTVQFDGSCDSYTIYKNDKGNLFLQIADSLPKAMYYTNPKNTFTDTGWFFVIEEIRGFAAEGKLENIKRNILNKLSELKVEPLKIPWHQTNEDKYDPPI